MTSWMLVEDEADLFEMLMGMFELLGLQGAAFPSGEDAFAWLDNVDDGLFHAEDLPELALLDIRLPGELTGLDVGARIRQSPVLGNIAIALMTAYRLSPAQEREAIQRSGADILLYKPLPDFKKLQQTLNALAASKKQV